MGLFLDDNGIPISYQLFPGSNIVQTTLRPAMKKTIDNMNFGRVIIIANGGLNSGPNIVHILDNSNGYIVSKSTKKSDKNIKAWIQHKILKHLGKQTNSTVKWESGLSAERIQKALCNWQADALPCGYFRTTKPSEDLKLILDAFGIDGDLSFPIEPELRQMKYVFDNAI